MRLTIVTQCPTPYRTSLYEEIDRRLRARGGQLTVVYGAYVQPGHQWVDDAPDLVGSVRSVFVPATQLRIRGKITYVNPLAGVTLMRTRPDVAVLGGYAPWIYGAVAACRVRGVPYLIWTGETTHSAEVRGTRPGRRLPLLRGARGYVAYGPGAADYLQRLGMSAERITVLGNGVAIDRFAARTDAARERRAELRTELGFEGPTILSVGGKELDHVLTAMERLPGDVQLALAGRPRDPGVLTSDRLIRLGRRPPARMPELYAAADCLAHPASLDRWPHAINEALSAGLPVVASRFTGVPDEVLAGPGCTVTSTDAEPLAAALDAALAVGRASTTEVREAVRAPLRPWGVDRMAERMIEAAQSVGAEP